MTKNAALIYTIIVLKEQEREERKMGNMIPNAMTWVTLENSNAALPAWLRIALIAFTAGMIGFLVYIVIKDILGR